MDSMTTDWIRAELFSLRDESYRAFQSKLIPTVRIETMIGVRTPELRRLARRLSGQDGAKAFLAELPHRYFDENQLHAFLLSEMKDYAYCVQEVERFLPWVDNWATCDQLSPKVFRKHRAELLERIRVWLASEQPFTQRFAIGMLMQHYLDESFSPVCLSLAAGIRSEEYYVRMMIAWYFATALAKQYEAALPILEENRLDVWTHNKTIQKATESYRIRPEQKTYLRSLRRNTTKE